MSRLSTRPVLHRPTVLAAISASLLAGAGWVALEAQAAPSPTPAATARVDAPLIPREALFGNPSRTLARISPDGKAIAFLAPRDGVMNIHVAPRGSMDEAKPLTEEKVRPIRQFLWRPDSSQVLYIQDKGGDENFLLYGTALTTAKTTAYTPFEKTRAEIVMVSPEVPGAMLVGLNNRDPRWHDVHRLDLTSGKLELVRQNDGYQGFEADRKLAIRLATKPTEDGGMVVERVTADGGTEKLISIPADDALTSATLSIPEPGTASYMLDTRNRDTAALSSLDIKTGQVSVLAENPKADVGDILTNPKTGVVEAYSVDYLKNEWVPMGPAVAGDITFLNEATKGGQWSVMSRSLDDKFWTILVDRVTEAASFYLYDRDRKALEKLFTTRPELDGLPLAPMHAREIKSRDGMTLVSYLTLPPGTDKDGDGRPDQPLPMVLNVHGGPWARDTYGYDSEAQWLGNRGYAVLQVNFRGSSGFGKAFLNAGDKAWGREMHNDLLDAVDWAVKEGVTTRDRVAIYGGSYGGYAVLAGLTFTPDVFACGVDIVGPSNLMTLLNSVPPYWASFYQQLVRRVGDPKTEEGQKLLKERSPLTFAENIKKPLLIAQGANDPRVKQAESDQIVTAMKAKNIPVTYVLYPDEGHGFARPENRLSFYAVAEGFLAQCLGGRQEPVGDDFKGSSIQVPEGASFVKGLPEALAGLKAQQEAPKP